MSQALTTDSLNNPTVKGLNTDLASHLQTKEIWTYARNAVLNSHAGNMYALQNEQSNIFCADLPYTFIGSIPLIENRFAIFTTDNVNSEIGIFDPKDCSYTKVVNDACLGFNTHNLISGKSKYNADCSETVYWADSGLNSRRYLNLQNVPYINTGTVCDPNNAGQLNCNKLLMDPVISIPITYAELAAEGNLKNGTYQFAIAYSIKKERITDIYSFTNPISIFSHGNTSPKGVHLTFVDIDETFDEFELFVTFDINNVVSYRSLGFYSTSQKQLTIVTVDRPEYTAILPEDIFVKKQVYEKADWCTGNDKYLLWSGLKLRPEIGYQPQAMKITANYFIVEGPPDYYKYGGRNVGYYGDEVYAFSIDWLRQDGSYTNEYHIPGTTLGANVVANPLDVYETSTEIPCGSEVPPGWYVQNTASRLGQMNIPYPQDCSLFIVASGTMAYVESELLYPNNDDMFPNDKCKPIRHHRFPNEAVEPRYHGDVAGLTGTAGNIRIKTIRFNNIEHPKDINGNYIPDIVGYRIMRSDRSGNRTVIARGYSTNMGIFQERADPENLSSPVTSTIYYPNYPYNDVRPDPFLSKYFHSSSNPPSASTLLNNFSKGAFTFYSPHTLIGQVALSSEVIIETEEGGSSIGRYHPVYEHPRFKLLTDFALAEGAFVGFCSVIKDIIFKASEAFYPIAANGLSAPPLGFATAALGPIISEVLIVGGMVAGLPGIIGDAINITNTFLDIILNTAEWQSYAIQYDSSCLFNRPVPRTSIQGRRRFLKNYTYLGDGLNVFPGQVDTYINNFKKPNGVLLNLGATISGISSVIDVSRDLFSTSNYTLSQSFIRAASVYYMTIKRRRPDQYGTLDSVKYVNTGYSSAVTLASPAPSSVYYTSDIIFGGDCFINQFSVNQPQPYFTAYPLNTPDGTIWDYRNYRNIAYPTYWITSQPYDVASEIRDTISTVLDVNYIRNLITAPMLNILQNLSTLNIGSISNTGGTTLANIFSFSISGLRYNLDKNPLLPITNVVHADRSPLNDPAYMYTSYNGTAIVFVESDYNLEFRDYRANISNVYTINSSLDWIYRSDNLFTREEFVYDMSYSKQNTEVFAIQQFLDFNLKVANECSPYWPNSVIYSLPTIQDKKQDNWLYYLPNNIYTFAINDVGNLISIYPIDNQQIIFFFDKSAPYISIGRDELQTQGNVKVTIGDAGLFNREPRPIEYTDYKFGTCTSRFAFAPTAYGNYFPSQAPGKVFMQSGNRMKEISKEGNKYWFSEYLPSQLLKQFPDFIDKDNPVIGVGMTSIYDATNERYILTKRDYKCLDSSITYISGQNKFVKDGEREVSLSNKEYFEDASWTISYKGDVGVFVAWHDYHPMSYLQGGKHFMSIQGSTIYKHDEVYNSYCNFYNMDYPFAVQLPINNEVNIETIRSVEFYAETYVYKNQWDYFHVLDTTFDYALISNSEQVSGWLHLNSIVRNQVSQQFLYPYYNTITNQYEVKIDKVENKYRFNQFWDITKDRGEYSTNQFNLISTESNGYIFDLNPLGIDYAKPQTQRKKFRHKTAKLYLEKEVSNDNKITLHFTDTKQTKSPR